MSIWIYKGALIGLSARLRVSHKSGLPCQLDSLSLKFTNEPSIFVDWDLAESKKQSASVWLGESVLYGSSPDFSRVLSRHLASSRNSFPCTTLSYPGQPFSFQKKKNYSRREQQQHSKDRAKMCNMHKEKGWAGGQITVCQCKEQKITRFSGFLLGHCLRLNLSLSTSRQVFCFAFRPGLPWFYFQKTMFLEKDIEVLHGWTRVKKRGPSCEMPSVCLVLFSGHCSTNFLPPELHSPNYRRLGVSPKSKRLLLCRYFQGNSLTTLPPRVFSNLGELRIL